MLYQKTIQLISCGMLLASFSASAADSTITFSSYSGMFDYGVQSDGSEVLTLSQIRQCLLEKQAIDQNLQNLRQQQRQLSAKHQDINQQQARLSNELAAIATTLEDDLYSQRTYQHYTNALRDYNENINQLNSAIDRYQTQTNRLLQTAINYNTQGTLFNQNCVINKRYNPKDLAKIQGNHYQLVLGK